MKEYFKIFIEERFWIHFSGCIALAYIMVAWLITHAQFKDFGVIVGALVTGGFCFCIGFCWEWFWDNKGKSVLRP